MGYFRRKTSIPSFLRLPPPPFILLFLPLLLSLLSIYPPIHQANRCHSACYSNGFGTVSKLPHLCLCSPQSLAFVVAIEVSVIHQVWRFNRFLSKYGIRNDVVHPTYFTDEKTEVQTMS